MLSKDDILRLTDRGLLVFRHYVSSSFTLGRNFLNPLYQDKKASCNIYFDKHSNIYRMKDFGNDDYSGDCFAIVGKIKGKDCSRDFAEILTIINNDLNLGLSDKSDNRLEAYRTESNRQTEPELQSKPNTRAYTIVQQCYSPKDLTFWSKLKVSRELLQKYKVVSLKDFNSVNKDAKAYKISSTANEPMFGYIGVDYVKIYRPFSEIRFLYGGNIENYCFGLEQLPSKGDLLFITSGEKDVIVLAAHGFNAICFNSETSSISKEIIKKLSFRFKHIVLLYDMDKTGQDTSLKHQKELVEFEVKRLLLPLPGTKESKDITNFFSLGNSAENLHLLFLDLLDRLYNDTLSLLKSCEISFKSPPLEARRIISINDIPLGTQGNLLCVTGGEGTGKSNYVASMIAGAIQKSETDIDTLGLKMLPKSIGKAVVLYDTEQSESQLYKNAMNIVRRAKIRDLPPFLKVYSLTVMSRKQRLQSIIESMDKLYYQHKGIQLIIIDGIADLVRGVNDEHESIAVIEELYRLAGIYNTCIVCVLHFIPNGLKLRGHLGSELQRKSAAIISIEQDKNPRISVVKVLKVRDGSPLDIPIMQFSWNKELGMHSFLGEKSYEEKENRKETELINVAKEIFDRQRQIAYADLCDQLQLILDVKERTAKTYIKFMKDKNIIIKDPSNISFYILQRQKS